MAAAGNDQDERIRALTGQLEALQALIATQGQGGSGIGGAGSGSGTVTTAGPAYGRPPTQDSGIPYVPTDSYPGGLHSRLLPRDYVGGLGQPHALAHQLLEDPTYSHAVTTRVASSSGLDRERLSYEAIAYGHLLSILAYLELHTYALQATQSALDRRDVEIKELIADIEVLVPEPVPPAAGASEEEQQAYLTRRERRTGIVDKVRSLSDQVAGGLSQLVQCVNTVTGVLGLGNYSLDFCRTQLGPPHLVPAGLRAAARAHIQTLGSFSPASSEFGTFVSDYASAAAAARLKETIKQELNRKERKSGGKNSNGGKNPNAKDKDTKSGKPDKGSGAGASSSSA